MVLYGSKDYCFAEEIVFGNYAKSDSINKQLNEMVAMGGDLARDFLTKNYHKSCHAFIIPDELPSLLSVIYSNIPTIKKGTDSRIGWGFRLGDRADFQVLVELGPQTYTQPLGNQQDKNTNRKRNTLNNLADTLYAQQQDAKNQIPGSDAAKWLSEWRNSLNKPQQLLVTSSHPKPGLGIGEIDAKSVIPDDSIIEMQEVLHKTNTPLKKAAISNTPTTTNPTTTQKSPNVTTTETTKK